MQVLGLSFGVDTAAALVRDGQVVGAVLQERFSRLKHDRAWPGRAIDWCLREGGTTLDAIDEIAFFWNPALQLDFPHPGRASTYRHHGDFLHMVPSWLLGAFRDAADLDSDEMLQEIRVGARTVRIRYVAHHRCHAASAFLPSPFDQAAVLTVDGFGERHSTTLGAWRGDYELLEAVRVPDSLGSFYAAITGYLGFRPNSGEGKVMGLAPYGDDRYVARFQQLLGLDRAAPFELDLRFFEHHLDTPDRVSRRFVDEFGPPPDPRSERGQAIAFAAQAVTEEAMLRLARRLHDLTGLDDLVLAGGVAMNSCANGRIEREGPFRRVWVQPAAGDGGTAVGAALWASRQAPRQRWVHDRWGPAFDDEACRTALRRGGWTWREPPELADDVADALARGAIVGWFQGRAELGARALGGRSILVDPRDPATRDVVNARIKFREGFRPFAPSVLAERAADLFDLPAGVTVPFMQKVHPVRPEARPLLGAVTHVDGSARLQTVDRDAHPRYHALIAAFARRTGVPALLNTSFNVRGEPMVLTPEDAIRCWATTGLDLLVLGPCVVEKPRG